MMAMVDFSPLRTVAGEHEEEGEEVSLADLVRSTRKPAAAEEAVDDEEQAGDDAEDGMTEHTHGASRWSSGRVGVTVSDPATCLFAAGR